MLGMPPEQALAHHLARHVDEDGEVEQRTNAIPGRLGQQQVIAFDHEEPRIGAGDEGVLDDILDLARIARPGHIGSRRPERPEKAHERRAIEGMRHALVGDRAQRLELGMAAMKAVHGYIGCLGPKGGDEPSGERRLADARSTGKADDHAPVPGQGPGPLDQEAQCGIGAEGEGLLRRLGQD